MLSHLLQVKIVEKFITTENRQILMLQIFTRFNFKIAENLFKNIKALS